MTPEQQLAAFVAHWRADALPADARDTVRLMGMATLGAGVAGRGEDGVAELRALLLERGGAPQATSLVFGDRLSAVAAAQLGGTLCRALDYCDAMAPGPHFGSAIWPAALAAADLAGGCSGAELLVALAIGAELGARFNLTEAMYDGFDPTGVAAVFAATGTAARLLGLRDAQCLHALALAFNRCGGSFQSHVDGSLGVRAVQGWVAETGIVCAQMAQRGFTGPHRFLSGHYGYAHLFGRGRLRPEQVTDGLGHEWRLRGMMFKPYPSCGATQGVTALALDLVRDAGLRAEQVRAARIALPPYAFKLVGHPWRPGANPRVDAQFSARYCVANAVVRKGSKLAHFRPEALGDADVAALIDRIEVVGDAALDPRGHTAVDLRVDTVDGRTLHRSIDIAPGFPGNALDAAQHRARWDDCMAYAPRPLADGGAQGWQMLQGLATLDDARALTRAFVAPAD